MDIDIFIKGKEIDLISLNDEIIETSNWYKWFNDEELTTSMQHHYYPNTKKLQEKYYNSAIQGNVHKIQCGIYYKADKVMIGVISLSEINFFNRNCEISLIIGERQYQNLSILVESQRLMLRHAFDTLNMHRVYGGSVIKEINTLFCRALGYTSEGIFRQHIYKNGEYVDSYKFGILKPTYLKLKNKWFEND